MEVPSSSPSSKENVEKTNTIKGLGRKERDILSKALLTPESAVVVREGRLTKKLKASQGDR